MILIIGFTCPPTIHFKFITKCDKCYYKVRQVLQSETILLQSATVDYLILVAVKHISCIDNKNVLPVGPASRAVGLRLY